MKTILTECRSVLTLSLGLHEKADFDFERENILISGSTGSGKTTICNLLGDIFNKAPYYTFTKLIDCKSLKGKTHYSFNYI